MIFWRKCLNPHAATPWQAFGLVQKIPGPCQRMSLSLLWGFHERKKAPGKVSKILVEKAHRKVFDIARNCSIEFSSKRFSTFGDQRANFKVAMFLQLCPSESIPHITKMCWKITVFWIWLSFPFNIIHTIHGHRWSGWLTPPGACQGGFDSPWMVPKSDTPIGGGGDLIEQTYYQQISANLHYSFLIRHIMATQLTHPGGPGLPVYEIPSSCTFLFCHVSLDMIISQARLQYLLF